VPRGEVLALARIDRDRELVAIAFVREVIDQLRHEGDRNVVDGGELDILERTQRGALARSTQPRDDHDLHDLLDRVREMTIVRLAIVLA